MSIQGFRDAYGLWLVNREALEDEIDFDQIQIHKNAMRELEAKMQEEDPKTFASMFNQGMQQ